MFGERKVITNATGAAIRTTVYVYSAYVVVYAKMFATSANVYY